uniref:Uncharacterized protein n=1 Tax=Rhizophora mucronata TaxID=61149 RepID=A0A2P2QRG0_RHIMU
MSSSCLGFYLLFFFLTTDHFFCVTLPLFSGNASLDLIQKICSKK